MNLPAARRRIPAALGLALLVIAVLPSCGGPAAITVPALDADPGAPFAFRDPRAGAPAGLVPGSEADRLDEGMAALREGAFSRAEKIFRKGDARAPKGAFQLGLAYVALAQGKEDEAAELLAPLLDRRPPVPAAVEAMADLEASQEEWRDATLRYRTAAKLLPGDSRLEARLRAAVAAYLEGLESQARASLASGSLEEARRAGLAMVDVSPGSPGGYEVLARTAAAGGQPDDAWGWAARARSLGAKGPDWQAFQASLAMRTRRFGEAVDLYVELAATDPSFREKADEARLEFRIENLPERPRKAAHSARLTRAELASLLWWEIPEVREATAAPSPEVAIDVVDHPDRQAIVRAIGLGFLQVSRENHRVRVEAPVSRADFAAVLRRLSQLVGRGQRPVRCLSGDSGSAALAACGILPESKSRTVSGKEALRAIERTARLAREGENR